MARLSMRIMFCVAVVLGFTVLPAYAQGFGPGFHAAVFFDGRCGGQYGLSAASAPATLGPVDGNCLTGSATGAGEAGAGTMRALAQTRPPGTAVTGRARMQIENIIISGPPAASIPISLNFQLRGTLASHPDNGQAGVSLYLALSGAAGLLSNSELYFSHIAILNQSGIFAPLSVPFPAATIDQSFTTQVVSAVPNQPISLEIAFAAWSNAAGLQETHSDFFSGANGFALPAGAPVFNLPEGYTVHIPELNVVDNRWQTLIPPAVSVSPGELNFGSVAVGSSLTSLVTVTNTGGPGLQVNVGLTPAIGSFSVLSLKKNATTVTAPVTLDANETLDVEIAFSPPAPAGASAALLIDSSAGDVVVPLNGEGVVVDTPPSAQIAELLSFFDASVDAGTLRGSGHGSSEAGRLKALRNMIQAASDFINQANLAQACQQLRDVLDRIDGLPRPPDFAAGTAVEEIRTRITELRTALGCL